MKNVLAIHDISCVGRCSLTVALPIISAYGVTCSVLPTAVLSTHTGGFSNFTCLDLTEEMKKIISHWDSFGQKFDAIYSGFMASSAQIDVVADMAKKHKTALKIVDPVMADHGVLYKIFDNAFVEKMKELVAVSDVLIPNMTEAALLTGIEYKEDGHNEKYIESLFDGLKKLGAKNIVLTGVSFEKDKLGVACLEGNKTSYHFAKKIDGSYHGTGDTYGSVLTAHLMKGLTLSESAKIAVDFVIEAILKTPSIADKKYGVDFEAVLDSRA